jgi:heme-degrading monooxygenase HmoA
MILRTFVFEAKAAKRRTVAAFMRRRALPLLKRIPACRAAFFTRNPVRRGEYMWVTVWSSPAALRRAQRRPDWKEVVRIEEGDYFAGRPRHRHFEVLFKK